MSTVGHAPSPGPRVTRRQLGLDLALAFGLSAAAVATALATPHDSVYRNPGVGGVVLALTAGATAAWRRSRPLAACVVACVIVIVNASIGYVIGAIQYPAWLALYSTIAYSTRRRDRVAAIACTAGAVVGYAVADRGTVSIDITVGIMVLFALALLGGEVARTRRTLAETEHARVLLQAQQESAARDHTLLQERSRLARELHDALGHAVNVMVMQAGVGRHVFDERPDFARSALAQIETVGRDALVELDGVLRVLRPDNDRTVERTIASLAGLDTLCDRIRATGRAVDLHVGNVQLGPSGERAAYRIVQEAITNAARHSSEGPIEVSIVPGSDHAVITVRNAGVGFATSSPGRGLVNMRERARLEGGDLRCGPTEDGFVVRATLPTADARLR